MAATERSAIIVCDAGPLIHLDELNCTDLLSDYPEILVPEAVWNEVRHHRPSALRRRRISLRRVETIPEAEESLRVLSAVFPLDPGEEQALRLMQRFPNALLLSDDQAAREVAIRLRYAVRGTLGVLVLGWERGHRTKRQVLNLLRTIHRRSTLHVSQRLVDTVIARVEERTL